MAKKRKQRRQEQRTPVSWSEAWRTWFRSKGPILLFGAKWGALVVLLYVLLDMPGPEKLLYRYLEANAWVSNLVLNFLGQQTNVSDVTIRSSQFAIAIERGCDAVEPTWLLCAAMLAFPGRWATKFAGIGLAIVALQALNIVRIVTLYLIGTHFRPFFDSAHLEIWPVIFIVSALALFVGWKGWALES
jgi:exosortase/archaeosortase family protein